MTDREYNRLRAKQWREDNREKYNVYARNYYQEHKSEILARRKANRQAAKPTD